VFHLHCISRYASSLLTSPAVLQFLIEKVIRSRIWDSNYWKEHCFALNAVSIIDRAAALKYVGGTFGGHNQPTEFICLVLKLLQLGPDREIILEYLRAEDFK
jgi:pre-mRNA-splicing factor 38A